MKLKAAVLNPEKGVQLRDAIFQIVHVFNSISELRFAFLTSTLLSVTQI
jgi:hypothetical protein